MFSSRPFRRCLLVASLAIAAGGCDASGDASDRQLAEADVAAIHAVIEAFRVAWLAGDKTGVLNTFTDDAVLAPHHGDPPIVGKRAIEAYWFPAASAGATVITDLRM